MRRGAERRGSGRGRAREKKRYETLTLKHSGKLFKFQTVEKEKLRNEIIIK